MRIYINQRNVLPPGISFQHSH